MIQMRVKRIAFSVLKVVQRADVATQRVLSKFGAFVMTGARRSIRKRKASSRPGSPPSSHMGFLKRFIFFDVSLGRKSVIIGPARIQAANGEQLPALEYGGPTTIRLRVRGKRRRTGRRVRVVIAARPFMGPSFEEEKRKLPLMWRDSIKKK